MLSKALFIFMLPAFVLAMDFSLLSAKEQECFNKLAEEAEKVLINNPEYIQAQVRLTSLKLAHKVLKRKGLHSNTIESYANSIIGPKTLERFNNSELIKDSILKLKKSFGQKESLPKLESLRDLSSMQDKDIANLMLSLQETWKGVDSFGFNSSDYAIGWFLSRVEGNSSIIAQQVNTLLLGSEQSPNQEKLESKILKNIKKANSQLKAQLTALAGKVHKKFKKQCIVKNINGEQGQITSVFNAYQCDKEILPIVNQAFLKALDGISDYVLEGNSKGKNLRSKDLLKQQDKLNEKSDLEKIIGFHKVGFDKTDCEGYVVVDKKNSRIQLYTNDGNNILDSKGLIGDQARSDQKLFNPDARLRRFDNRTYTRTTGAGIYYTKKDITNRENRDYYREFDNRVMVLSFLNDKGSYEEEKILAIHGVPGVKWIGKENRDMRLKSLDNKSMNSKLTTGCVNITGFDYDLINEYMGHQCPVYILPQDDENFYHITNGQLIFTTKNELKLSGRDNSLKKQDGKMVKDENNFNIIKYNKARRLININNIDTSDSSLREEFLLAKEDTELFQDDLMDIFSLKVILDNTEDSIELERIITEVKKLNKSRDYVLSSTFKRRERILKNLGLSEKLVPELIIIGSQEVEFE